MFPWFWVWNPQIHWPLSGSVSQDINPELDWFFQAIPQQAGKAVVEKAIFQQYSYGKQLGILMEAMKPLVDSYKLEQDQARILPFSIGKFDALVEDVAELKEQVVNEELVAAEQALEALKVSDSEAFEALISRYQS